MKKLLKICSLLLFIFLISGCEAVYDVEINSNGLVTEKLSINGLDYDLDGVKSKFLTKPVDKNVNFRNDDLSQLPEGTDLYDLNFEMKDNKYSAIYSFNRHNIDSFKNSAIVDYSVSRFSIVSGEDGTVQIYSTKGLLSFKQYDELDRVYINIKTDYYVSSHNADKVKDNVYTWIFDDTDTDKSIALVMNPNGPSSSTPEIPDDPSRVDPGIIEIPEKVKPEEPTKKEETSKVQQKIDEITEGVNPFIIILIGFLVFIVALVILYKLKK